MRISWKNHKLLLTLLILAIALFAGCDTKNTPSVPADFLFIMDVKSAREFDGCVHINIRIDADRGGRYDVYDTGCAIEYDTNHMVTYLSSQVIEKGQFKLNEAELEGLWEAINKNNFFNLTEDYRMAMGFSYAFIVIEANGRRKIVDNIGMEVPEIRAIIEATDAIMPEGVNLDYGEGFLP
jgi:hypothetical protein